jgi:hypothetical protein
LPSPRSPLKEVYNPPHHKRSRFVTSAPAGPASLTYARQREVGGRGIVRKVKSWWHGHLLYDGKPRSLPKKAWKRIRHWWEPSTVHHWKCVTWSECDFAELQAAEQVEHFSYFWALLPTKVPTLHPCISDLCLHLPYVHFALMCGCFTDIWNGFDRYFVWRRSMTSLFMYYKILVAMLNLVVCVLVPRRISSRFH